MHSSPFLLRYDHTKQPYHVRDEISMDDEKSGRRGSSPGIVTATFMIGILVDTSVVAQYSGTESQGASKRFTYSCRWRK